MMDKIFKRQFHQAMIDGRKCSHCGWMITKKNWKKGARLCYHCEDAFKGVNISRPFGKMLDEPLDKTGEML